LRRIRALIFDFDGLILDTEAPVFQSWQELYAAFGLRLELSEWSQYIGLAEGAFDFFAILQERLGRKLDASLGKERSQRELQLIYQQPVLPGVLEYLQAARRLSLKVGLASSSSCAWVTGHLQRLDLLSCFDCLRASDDVRSAKPDPELYQAVLDVFGLGPHEALALEDSFNGVLAARRAGIFTVAVPNPLTEHMPLQAANLRLRSLTDLSLEALLAQAERDAVASD
jgi:HAD superfamily hydrolase (TIGR01509 family)